MRHRNEQIKYLKENPDISVLIIGAGINGIGTFREMALQGVDVVMIDRGDFCSGASAASSHMVHGGIRYLENGEFQLVKEAVGERNRLIENAPHLVRPLPTTFPIFKWFSGLLNAPLKFLGLLERPSERGAVVIKVGMMFYDYFTRKQKTVPKHVFHNREESLALFPDINPNVLFTGIYYDGAMPSPERIAYEVLQDAVEANDNAIPLNYTELVSAKGNLVTVKDEFSGEVLELRPKILINAAGPWIDLVNGVFGKKTNFISSSKGSHLVLDHPELREAIRDHEFFFENQDGRIVLIFPLYDKVMIGTSDIIVDDPNHIVITDDEVKYFFNMVGRIFPNIEITNDQIVFTFSGVRPLQHSEGKKAGQISRNHKVKVIEAGDLLDMPVLSLVGGKWTSFRAFSEHAADIVFERLGVTRSISTENMAVGGSKDMPKTAAAKDAYLANLASIYAIDLEWLTFLFERYGTKVEALLSYAGKDAAQALISLPDHSVGELRYIASEENVFHLDDLILRRTMIGKLGKVTPESLREIAVICAPIFCWSDEERKQEIARFEKILHDEHKMDHNKFMGGQV